MAFYKINRCSRCIDMYRPFEDLKVIELAGVLAGPSVGYFFSELGAKVIKVENPKTGGDVTRSWKLKKENPKSDTSAYFWSVNARKEFLALDITKSLELSQLYELVKTADIIITNYKKGDDEKLQVDYATLKKIKPDIIYASINGFGNDSPRTAYDLILQAESGFMHMNGEPNSMPVKMPVALIDLLAGHQLKEAILIALIKKLKSNEGSYVSVSLFDSALASLANQATNWLIGGNLPEAQGSLHPNIAPYGELFKTKDKQYITFAIGSNKQFQALCELLNFHSLATESKFSSNQNRVKNRSELYKLLDTYISKLNYKDLMQACLEREIPIGKIRNLKEVFELPEAQSMIHRFTFNEQSYDVLKSIAFRFIQ
jgi:crotonobetainyl-CoA:carnitine CoA-transferase CaiB-like acyl-CoA transferase